jgi:hypothetical protein
MFSIHDGVVRSDVLYGRPILGAICLLLASCATGSAQSTGYEALKQAIISNHDAALIEVNAPYLFSEDSVSGYVTRFVAAQCPGEGPKSGHGLSAACERRFSDALTAAFEDRYFAADPEAVEQACAESPMVCEDPATYEVLFRRLHNRGVEASRQAKLSELKDWTSGQISDEQLKNDLKIDFSIKNGTFRLGSADRYSN